MDPAVDRRGDDLTAEAKPPPGPPSGETPVPRWAYIAAAFLVLGAWPTWRLGIATGVDPSWTTGLTLARVHHLAFGQQIGYTYGPLGFATVPLAFDGWGLLVAALYTALGLLALVVGISLLALRRFREPYGYVFVGVLLLTAPIGLFASECYSLGLVAIGCAVAERPLRGRVDEVVAALGAATAAQFLVKPGAGVIAAGACAISVLAAGDGRLRRSALAAGAFTVVLLALWLALAQPLRTLPDWVLLTVSLSRGYANALAYEDPARRFEYVTIVALVAALAVVAVRGIRTSPRRIDTMVEACVLGLVMWVVLKESFIRHDLHSALAFFAVGVLALAVGPDLPGTSVRTTMIVASCLLTATAVNTSVVLNLDPTDSVRSALASITAVVLPSERGRIAEDSQESAMAAYALPPAFLHRMQMGTVHLDPSETSAIQAYGLRWAPVPVFQRFQAYSMRADQLNAEMLGRDEGPDRILRKRVEAIDGRNDLWNSPLYVLGLLCRYRQWGATERWQLLERNRDRCGRETVIARQTAAAGEDVTVPAPRRTGSVVVARVRWRRDLTDRLAEFLLKPRRPFKLAADGSVYRVAQGPDSGPIVVRVPSSLGWGPAFGGGTSYHTLRANDRATYEFSEIPAR
jgi:hypothetical protein